MRKSTLLTASLICLLTIPLAAQNGSETLTSPDSKLVITFETLTVPEPQAPGPPGSRQRAPEEPKVSAEGGQLTYRVTYNGKPLLESSKLGLDLQGMPALGSGVKIVAAHLSEHDETYRLVVGKNNPVRDHYNELKLDLEETSWTGRKLTIEARAYDDGAAFRYVVPEQPQTQMREFRLVRELTEFHFAKDATAYPLYRNSHRTSYEGDWVKTHLMRLLPDKLIGLPLLTEVPGVAWLAITEADLDEYAGMHLVNVTENAYNSTTTLGTFLSPNLDEPGIAVSSLLPHHSPWRVLMIADDPGRLVESNIILNLNPPCAIADTSWIKAGKSAWSWWSGYSATGAGFEGGMNTRTMNYYTDFAAEAGLEYTLIDGGWSARGDILTTSSRIDMPEIIRYAESKNVKVWVWLHWTSAEQQMVDAFPLYEKWGVVGVKIDFMDSNDQRMVDFYHRTAKLAAEHHLMIDFHGAYPPTGLRRTYPNVMTYEGILGQEYNKWSALPDPDHDVMIPYTRMLAGPMDYTPGGFENKTKADFVSRQRDPMVMGTRAHQLALFVVLESPLQMVSDRPAAYADQPSFAFIKAVPANWDETRMVSGDVGEYAVIARRHGKEWYLGAITNWTPRQIEIPLGFLGPGQFVAEIFADAADAATAPKHVTIDKRSVGADAKLKLDMAPGGGTAIRFSPAN